MSFVPTTPHKCALNLKVAQDYFREGSMIRILEDQVPIEFDTEVLGDKTLHDWCSSEEGWEERSMVMRDGQEILDTS
jgi:hypothetical protein